MSDQVRVSLSRGQRAWVYGAMALSVLFMIAYLRLLIYMRGLS